jgi:hypothetical protein
MNQTPSKNSEMNVSRMDHILASNEKLIRLSRTAIEQVGCLFSRRLANLSGLF